MLVERRNGIVVCMIELLGEFVRLSVDRAGERRGDVAYFMLWKLLVLYSSTGTTQSAPCQGNTNPVEGWSKPQITGTVMCLGIWHSSVLA